MDCVEEDLRKNGVTKFVRTTGKQRMLLSDIVKDSDLWGGVGSTGIYD